MSKSVEKASRKGRGEQAPASVFDFLYHDSRRVGSILSQLDQNGLLKEIRAGEHASRGSKRGFSANVGASTPLTGGGNLGIEITPKEGGGESLERVYDPFWANARELLDNLEANNMIRHDVSVAPLGSVVLVSGALNIIDLGLMKEAWGVDEIKRTALAGGTFEQVGSQRSYGPRKGQHGQNRNRSADPPTEAELMLAFLQLMPHSLTALLHGSEGSMWCSLREENLVGSGSDLVLKHGLVVSGDWHMLGLLDARPDLDALTAVAAGGADDVLEGPGAALFNSIIGSVTRQIAPFVRVLLGRPANAFGITPLLIFRKVGDPSA